MLHKEVLDSIIVFIALRDSVHIIKPLYLRLFLPISVLNPSTLNFILFLIDSVVISFLLNSEDNDLTACHNLRHALMLVFSSYKFMR